jgi:hypothetical protein
MKSPPVLDLHLHHTFKFLVLPDEFIMCLLRSLQLPITLLTFELLQLLIVPNSHDEPTHRCCRNDKIPSVQLSFFGGVGRLLIIRGLPRLESVSSLKGGNRTVVGGCYAMRDDWTNSGPEDGYVTVNLKIQIGSQERGLHAHRRLDGLHCLMMMHS